MTKKSSGNVFTGSGLYALSILVVGGLLGYLFSTDIFEISAHGLMASFALGLIWAYFFVQWADMIGQGLSLLRDPIPESLNVAQREAVDAHLEKMSGHYAPARRAQHLLESWARGWRADQVVNLADLQSTQAKNSVMGGTLFVVLLILAALWGHGNAYLIIGSIMLLGMTILTRQSLLSRIDYYIESHLLVRLPANLPQTAMTAQDLAAALGDSIQKAFRENVPQPDKMAAAVSEIMVNAGKTISGDFEAIQSAVKESGKPLADLPAKVKESLAGATSGLEAALGNQAKQLEKVFNEMAAKLGENQAGSAGKIQEALSAHAQEFQKGVTQLTAQLEKINELEKNIQQIFHIQEAVDGTMKSVSATEEFKQTLEALRKHIEASDALIREVSKPRTIRLVEQDGELTAE